MSSQKHRVGDQLSIGSVILMLETDTSSTTTSNQQEVNLSVVPQVATPQSLPQKQVTPTALKASAAVTTYQGQVDHTCALLVLGSGPGGYSAAFRGADLGMDTILIERYATLGGVCLNVGCIPSKALLHTAAVMQEVQSMAAHGIRYGDPTIDLTALRNHKEQVISQLTTGLAGMAKARKVRTLRGVGSFLDANHLELQTTTGTSWELTGQK